MQKFCEYANEGNDIEDVNLILKEVFPDKKAIRENGRVGRCLILQN
ncbi:hypothetical protein MHSWG343_09240 [Candidatus Mycoplasma haematohominis]|uniref:Uncharacterized protein n=1 Tax=Candidatus Mycoplasma haematohominis TaxID=1494318 RepID=A0A478FRU1_9MOLU|nr:hypothetical protein MHSWG343_09240 [Candidatus Mycoplasma haemohominis]